METTTINDQVIEEVVSNNEDQETKDDDKSVSSDDDYNITKHDTLVLPGGGVKGLTILGALQYCCDNFMLTDIVNYVGTSSGSMICYLLAIGYTPTDIITNICCHQIMEKMQHFDLFAMINNLGATTFTSIYEVLEKLTIDKIGYLPTLMDIKQQYNKNLVFITYNLTKNTEECLSCETHPSLPCLVALRMSSNLPLIFENYKYNNNLYIDGGITNNFAINVGETVGTKVLGVYIHYTYSATSNTTNNNILEYIYKLIYIPIIEQQKNKLEKASREKCTIIDMSDSMTMKMFDFSISTREKLELFSAGYQQLKEKKI
jgi:predicted acylesterase/phospholipase RssA